MTEASTETRDPGRAVVKSLLRVWIEPPDLRGVRVAGKLANILEAEDLAGADVHQYTPGALRLDRGYHLTSPDGWQITTATDSLSIAKHAVDPVGAGEFEDFAAVAHKVADALDAGHQGRRLAAVVEVLFPEMDDADLEATVHSLFKVPPELNQVPWEWDWKHVSTVKRNFADVVEEPTNTIVSVHRSSGQFADGVKFDRVRGTFEVNTKDQERVARFDLGRVLGFLKEAPGWLRGLEEAVTHFIQAKEGTQA